MGDPELVARAQRAAVRLERSWDRWRRLHGLAAEQAQPVSSYVGYSLAEPWGRPRVVFGVGAEEAETLSALLEQDTGEDPRFSQGMLWEAEQPHRPEAGERGVNGTQPAEPVIPEARHGEPGPDSPAAGRGISADLAGWTSNELPGQASTGLALGPHGPGLGLAPSYGSAGLQVRLPA